MISNGIGINSRRGLLVNPLYPITRTTYGWYRGDLGILDGAGNPITVHATACGTWQDLSGNGRHLTEVTLGNRPLWSSTVTGADGRPGLSFTTVRRISRAAMAQLVQPYTIYSVARPAAAVGATARYILESSEGPSITMQSGELKAQSNTPATTTGTAVVGDNVHLTCMVANGASSVLRTERTSATPVETAVNLGTSDLLSAASPTLTVGSNGAATLPITGALLELIILAGADTLALRTEMFSYLRSRYAVSPL